MSRVLISENSQLNVESSFSRLLYTLPPFTPLRCSQIDCRIPHNQHPSNAIYRRRRVAAIVAAVPDNRFASPQT